MIKIEKIEEDKDFFIIKIDMFMSFAINKNKKENTITDLNTYYKQEYYEFFNHLNKMSLSERNKYIRNLIPSINTINKYRL